MRRLMSALIVATLAAAPALAEQQSAPTQRVGLVLSGGGAKGIAHIGVIQALEENNIAIDYITGTSMGAIVGGLYACGYSPQQMMKLIASRDFSYWSTGRIDPELAYYYAKQPESPTLYTISLGNDSVARRVPQSLISPLPMNFAFMELFAPFTAQCQSDFNKLFVPFRCVACDMQAKRKEVLSSGSVGDAIRASMTFPLVFSPIEIDGRLMYDGGIYENFPVDAMVDDFAPDIIIGVSVSSPQPNPAPTFVNQVDALVTQPQNKQLPDSMGIKLHIDLHEYSLLDFPKAAEIYAIGYKQGLEMVDSIKSRVTARRQLDDVEKARLEFRTATPRLRFTDINVTGGTDAQNRYVLSQFNPTSLPYRVKRARDSYYRALSDGSLKNLYPQAVANDSAGSSFTLKLKAYPKPPWSVSLGGFITSSTNSMLYAAFNYDPLRNNAFSGSLGGWIGQNYLAAQLRAAIVIGSWHPYRMSLQGVVSKKLYYENEQLFFESNMPHFVTDFEAFGRVYLLEMPAGRHGLWSISSGVGYLDNKYHDVAVGVSSSKYTLGQVMLRYDQSTLDAWNCPTQGFAFNMVGQGMYGSHTTPTFSGKETKWAQLMVSAKKYWSMSRKFSLGVEGTVLASTRDLGKVYEVALVDAPVYAPTPSCHNSFNSSFRAQSFLAAGITPVWKITSALQLRATGHVFIPYRSIDHDAISGEAVMSNVPGRAQVFAQLSSVYNLGIASLTAYANYRGGSNPDHGWHAGVSFGFFVLAPQFLQ
jgi:NTE family protein